MGWVCLHRAVESCQPRETCGGFHCKPESLPVVQLLLAVDWPVLTMQLAVVGGRKFCFCPCRALEGWGGGGAPSGFLALWAGKAGIGEFKGPPFG